MNESDIEDGIRKFTLNTPDWGSIRVLRPLPKDGDSWGVLASLRGTEYEPLIPVVTGESLSHALHGLGTPLMNEIGRPPDRLLRMVPSEVRGCAAASTCFMHDALVCHPCKKTPECYEPPLAEDAKLAAAVVVQAWRDGRYVLICEGEEFSL